jgi:hypothetical protein
VLGFLVVELNCAGFIDEDSLKSSPVLGFLVVDPDCAELTLVFTYNAK